MSDIDLQKETIQALIRAKGTWPRIVLDCDVSHSWLSKVVRGEIPNPRYRLLKKVHDYLLSQDSGQHDQETH